MCVNKKFVLPEQLTGRYKTCQLKDGTEKRFETATISIDTPYIKHGQIPVLCIEDPEVDRIIKGARCKCNPNHEWNLRKVNIKNKSGMMK